MQLACDAAAVIMVLPRDLTLILRRGSPAFKIQDEKFSAPALNLCLNTNHFHISIPQPRQRQPLRPLCHPL